MKRKMSNVTDSVLSHFALIGQAPLFRAASRLSRSMASRAFADPAAGSFSGGAKRWFDGGAIAR